MPVLFLNKFTYMLCVWNWEKKSLNLIFGSIRFHRFSISYPYIWYIVKSMLNSLFKLLQICFLMRRKKCKTPFYSIFANFFALRKVTMVSKRVYSSTHHSLHTMFFTFCGITKPLSILVLIRKKILLTSSKEGVALHGF